MLVRSQLDDARLSRVVSRSNIYPTPLRPMYTCVHVYMCVYVYYVCMCNVYVCVCGVRVHACTQRV